MALQVTKQNSLTDVANAWITFGTTKQIWLKNCLEYMASMKMGVGSRPGASTVRQRGLTSTKCDIFATPISSTISGDLTPQCKIFYNSRNRGGNGRFCIKPLNLLNKQSTVSFFKAVSGGRVGQFLAVFVHLSCEAIFVNNFLRGRPKSPLIV